MAAVGFIFAMICIFGVYVAEGGSMEPIIEAAPAEFATIFGSAVGSMIVANSMDVFKGAFAGFGKVIAGPKYKKEDFLGTIFVVAKIMKTLKAEGAVALEAHIEAPESSAIFAEHPNLLKDHGVLDLICNTVRLLVVSSGTLSPYAVEDIMDASIKLHHHNEMKPSQALAALGGALPALGIVSCVLGVVKTMAAIDQPPPVLGAMIGGALVGTFMGVLLAYTVAEPFSQRLGQIVDQEGEMYKVVKQMLIGTMHGHPVPLVIEAARVCISHHNQPTFGEVFDGLRGK